MSPTICGCVICGYLVDGYARSLWLKEFRAIYTTPDGISVSGVGRYDDPGGGTWIAPPHSDMRYDDADYQPSASFEIPVMQQAPRNGVHGFVLHDACWRLLRRAFEPAEVPVNRLYEVCASLPFPLRGIGMSWGHDYGGLATFDSEKHYPWEDNLAERWNLSEVHPTEDPYDIPEISDLLQKSSTIPESEYSLRIAKRSDCFTKLPWEILESIAVNLRTTDVLVLVQASTSFFPVLTSQSFWAPRFEAGGDREFLFEKRNNREARDWKKLYQLTSRACSPPGMKNRRRIWSSIKAVIDLLHFSSNKAVNDR